MPSRRSPVATVSASPGVASLGSGSATSTTAKAASDDQFSNMLAFSACMRSHGVKDFPDPTKSADGGGIRIQSGKGGGGSDLDPNSAVFQAAQRACQSLLPMGGLYPFARRAQLPRPDHQQRRVVPEPHRHRHPARFQPVPERHEGLPAAESRWRHDGPGRSGRQQVTDQAIPRHTGRRLAVTATAVLVLAGAGAAVIERNKLLPATPTGGTNTDNGSPTALATVARRDLTSQQQVNGTLGYPGSYQVIN